MGPDLDVVQPSSPCSGSCSIYLFLCRDVGLISVVAQHGAVCSQQEHVLLVVYVTMMCGRVCIVYALILCEHYVVLMGGVGT